MPTTEVAENRQERFDLELYKLLKAESSGYFDKLQAIWLQKFVLVGAVIAFLATTQAKLPQLEQGIVVPAAALAIPVLSALLDAKIMEFGLHARSISRFINTHYSGIGNLVSWEMALWGAGSSDVDRTLVRTRSLATVLTAVIPTMVVFLLSAVFLGVTTNQNALCLSLGFVVCVSYAVVTWFLWNLVWNKSRISQTST
jgi:hypothetical protein